MARLFKRGIYFYTWVPKPEGGTRKVATNCTDKTAALARAVELERLAVDPERAAAAKATLREALELLIRDRTSQAKGGKMSMETVEFYRGKAGVLVDGIAAVLKRSPKAIVLLTEVKASLVDDYIMLRREDGVEDSTIAKELTTWRAAMRLAKRRGLWPGRDIDEVFPKGFQGNYKPGERWVSPEELVKLYRAMVRPTAYRKHGLSDVQVGELRARADGGENRKELARAFGISTATSWKLLSDREDREAAVRGQELFAIVAFVIATGAEPSAVWRARRSDPTGDRSSCLVRGSKNARRVDRPVPLPLLGYRLLLEYAVLHADGEGQTLFPVRHASVFRRTLTEACQRAGIPHLCLTDLRRTHGKWLRLSGVAPDAIGPSLGHADGRMAATTYGKASAAELARVVEAQIAVGGGGLLMGRSGGEMRDSEGAPVVTVEHVSPGIVGAQTRNRTADTGIFNPFSTPKNDGRESNSAEPREANGPLIPGPRTESQVPVPCREDADDPLIPAGAKPPRRPLTKATPRDDGLDATAPPRRGRRGAGGGL